jgi:hypothetical protein
MIKKTIDKEIKVKYNSLTTPADETFSGHNANAFASEVVTYRHAIANDDILPPFFWRAETNCKEIYKQEFAEGCQCFGKMMKIYPEHFIINCCVYAKKLDVDYARITNYLKYKWEVWNTRVAERITMMIKSKEMQKTAIAEANFFTKEADEGEIRKVLSKKRVIL